MATTVTVTIAGRSYRMVCGAGEERHLLALGRKVDQTLNQLRADFGEIDDERLVIMTAVKLADELSEANRRIAELERQLTAFETTRFTVDVAQDDITEEIAESLDVAAERVERIVRGLREASVGQRTQP